MADLYRVNLALVGISFLSLKITSTFWLAFLHISLMWVLKFNCSSMVTPSNLRHSEDSMVFPWKCKGMLLSVLLCFKVIVWYLLRFPFSRLLAYHSEALLAFLKRLVLAIFGSPAVSDIWWSSAYMERCEVIYVCSITMGLRPILVGNSYLSASTRFWKLPVSLGSIDYTGKIEVDHAVRHEIHTLLICSSLRKDGANRKPYSSR